jgi:hypothetical protein
MTKEREILEKILEIANTGKDVGLHQDMGDNTLTVVIGISHTHVGCPDGTFDNLIDSLHDCLIGERGLSWIEDKTVPVHKHGPDAKKIRQRRKK